MARRRRSQPHPKASPVKVIHADGTTETEPPLTRKQLERHLVAQDRKYGGKLKRQAEQAWSQARYRYGDPAS